MTAVFVGGSRRVSRLNQAIRKRLDELMSRGLSVYVGDANGADRAIQRYLAASHYKSVTVFAVESHLRNNEGDWHVQFVAPPKNAKGYDLYAAKDRVMAELADAGVMLWDGRSRGTLENIRALLLDDKPIALYYAPKRKFLSLRSAADFAQAFPNIALKLQADVAGSRRPKAAQAHLLGAL
ncbi:MAG TPA: hypothetical protein VNL18_07350 [Gemmatimonadales bacterium]|nr:hypothetical protein [Gemmatimonadales bacterium]